jgi:phospholipid/cholesterol/gamma-HCH transport system substrate-binding protein
MINGDSRRLIRVGLFVGVTIAALVALLGILGRSRSLFSEKAVLNASFDNISGLVVGAPVRLAGIDIGIVQSIRFDRDLKIKKVRVALGIQGKYLERIRGDSVARLTSKGLLGDMLINISVGSSNFPPLKSGDTLTSQESEELAQVVGSVQDGIAEIRKLVTGVDQRVHAVMSDQVAQDISRIARSTANVMEGIEKGNGLLHRVLYDPKLGQDGAALVAQASEGAQHLSRSLKRADGILDTVEHGNGTLHGLIYRDDVGKLVAELQQTAAELGAVAREVKQGNGPLHSLIYGPGQGKSNLVTDLEASAHILRTLAEEVQQGKGTIGGLLQDPTVYQDLKGILGNVRRNFLLRTIIRSAIRSEGLTR